MPQFTPENDVTTCERIVTRQRDDDPFAPYPKRLVIPSGAILRYEGSGGTCEVLKRAVMASVSSTIRRAASRNSWPATVGRLPPFVCSNSADPNWNSRSEDTGSASTVECSALRPLDEGFDVGLRRSPIVHFEAPSPLRHLSGELVDGTRIVESTLRMSATLKPLASLAASGLCMYRCATSPGSSPSA
jgi:hypothetical protein